jgi:hypothetical protein
MVLNYVLALQVGDFFLRVDCLYSISATPRSDNCTACYCSLKECIPSVETERDLLRDAESKGTGEYLHGEDFHPVFVVLWWQ